MKGKRRQSSEGGKAVYFLKSDGRHGGAARSVRAERGDLLV